MNGGIKLFKSITFYIEKYINVHVNNNRMHTSLTFPNVYHTFNVTCSWQHPCVMSIYSLHPLYMKTLKLNCLTLSKFIQPAVAEFEPESGSSHTFMLVHTLVLEINHIKYITFLLPDLWSVLNIYILETDILFFLSPVRILCGHVHFILWVIIFLLLKSVSTAPKPTAILGLCFSPIYRPLLWKLDE